MSIEKGKASAEVVPDLPGCAAGCAALPAGIETREVLAECYRGLRSRTYTRRMLTHAVELNVMGDELRVLCNRVDIDSLADGNAGDRTEWPTCPSCARAVKKLTASGAAK